LPDGAKVKWSPIGHLEFRTLDGVVCYNRVRASCDIH
jgi:hypothetical protein